MKIGHWSTSYASSIDIQVVHTDASEQGWGYDCSRYLSLDTLKTNMAEDFKTIRDDWASITITVIRAGQIMIDYIPVQQKTGEDFVQEVFTKVDELLNGN